MSTKMYVKFICDQTWQEKLAKMASLVWEICKVSEKDNIV